MQLNQTNKQDWIFFLSFYLKLLEIFKEKLKWMQVQQTRDSNV